MASIGDLYFSLRADDKQLQVDVQKSGDRAGTSFGSRMAASIKKTWSGGQIGKGLVQGLGLAGGLGAAGLFSMAISKVTDVLGDATKAALEEEASIQKLGSSLKANVPNWDGNTAAIERVLTARMKLGFSDDEQRDSLARIVVATKDVNKALDVQRTAMDLARLKGISLAEAGDALIKIEGGQFRALKALGIVLPKNATQTEALAAVQKAANGQAEDYAKTNAGKLLVSQVKVGEAMEKFGAVTMPITIAAIEKGAEVVTGLAEGFDVLTHGLDKNADKADEQSVAILGLLENFGLLVPAAKGLTASWRLTFGKNLPEATDHWKGKTEDADLAIRDALTRVDDASGDLTLGIKEDTKAAAKSWDDLKDAIKSDADDVIDKAFDPFITADKLAATNAEINAARRVVASKTATDAEKRDAHSTLHSLGKDQSEYLVDLARAGETSSTAYQDGMKELRRSIRESSGPTKAHLEAVYKEILKVEAAGKIIPINFFITARNGKSGTGARAAGGPVTAGMPYIVGERRAELFVPEVNGRIVPQVPAGAGASGGLGASTHITVALPVTARPDPFETADALRWLADFGVLRP